MRIIKKGLTRLSDLLCFLPLRDFPLDFVPVLSLDVEGGRGTTGAEADLPLPFAEAVYPDASWCRATISPGRVGRATAFSMEVATSAARKRKRSERATMIKLVGRNDVEC